VAESDTGGWVRRVGASGGGRTYRKQRPLNFYGVIVLVCVIGTLSVAWARYEYRHPAAGSTTAQPRIGTTWYAAQGTSACGADQPALASNLTASGGFHALGNGAIRIAPATQAQAGTNATLDKFISRYIGLVVTSRRLVLPGPRGLPNPATTWRTGQKCPSGTKDAGKVGTVEIATWPNVGSAVPTITTDASKVRFTSNMLITFYFGPSGVTPPKPPASAIAAMFSGPTSGTTATTLPTTTPSLIPPTTTKG